jgi:hypothetical protein
MYPEFFQLGLHDHLAPDGNHVFDIDFQFASEFFIKKNELRKFTPKIVKFIPEIRFR